MKAAIDCTHLVEGRVGGITSFLINLLDGLSAAPSIDITLFVLESQERVFVRYRSKFSIRVVRVRGILSRIAWQNFVLPLYSIQFDVILFPAFFRPLFVWCKSVTVMHDLQYLYYPQYWSLSRLWYRKFFIPYSIRFSDEVIAISESTRQEILRNFRRDNIRLIYNPIRLGMNDEGADVSVNVPRPFVLIPSTLLPHKNIENLVHAVEGLDHDARMPFFVFIGPYEKREFPEYRSAKMKVLGFVEENVRDCLYAECSGVVLPSLYEGFGMPYVEALLSRKRVIASDIPPARELLGDTAIYIETPFGPDEIIAALKRFLNEDAGVPPAEMIDAIRQKTSPECVAGQYIAVLEGLTAGNRGANK